MHVHVLLGLSLLANGVSVVVFWKVWRWRASTLAMLHALLRMIQKNSAAIRRVQFEPWRDEFIDEATSAVDAQFSVVYGFLHPHDQIVIFDDPEPAPVPQEPGTED